MSRRQVLIAGIKIASATAATPFLFGCGGASSSETSSPSVDLSQPVTGLETRLSQELIASSKFATAGGQWTELQFNDLIDSMGEDSLKRTCKTLSIPPSAVKNYVSNPIMKKEIKTAIANASGGIFSKDPDNIKYHENVLLPTAQSMNIDKSMIETYDTLSLERAIYNKVLEHNWMSLNENERIDFLKQSSWNIEQDKIISLSALAGAGFLVGLSTVVNLSGFSFYIGMSNGLFALASGMGIVLPFTVYTGASSAVALATGPVGWVAAAVLAVAGVYAWMKSNDNSKEADMLRTVLSLPTF